MILNKKCYLILEISCFTVKLGTKLRVFSNTLFRYFFIVSIKTVNMTLN